MQEALFEYEQWHPCSHATRPGEDFKTQCRLRERPDVVIADYRMPECFGNYLIGRLREHPLTKDIPVIVLTGVCVEGTPDFGLERELRRIGATAYLTKPPDFSALLAELRNHIRIGDPVAVCAGAT